MIIVGDIVYRKKHGGWIHDRDLNADRSQIGLVIGTYQPKGCWVQFRVSFGNESPLWFESQQLFKIEASKKE